MYIRSRVIIACLAAVLLTIPTFLVFVPLGTIADYEEATTHDDIEVMDIPLVQPSSYYNGKVIHVGGLGVGNETTIQAGLNLADDRDQIWVYKGTYSEALLVMREVWIKGADGVRLVNPGGPNIGFQLDADNVTITSFNITDFATAISSQLSGHNFTGNVFWYNDASIRVAYGFMGGGHDYDNYGLVIRDNKFFHQTSSTTISSSVALLYDNTGPYDINIGSFQLFNNEFSSTSASNLHIYLDRFVYNIDGGTIDIADLRIEENTFKGGSRAVFFFGNLHGLHNVTTNVGQVVFRNNDVLHLTGNAFEFDYFSCSQISGSTTIDLGDIILTGNVITSMAPPSGGFYFIDRFHVDNIEDDVIIEYGDLLVRDNTIDVQGTAFYLNEHILATVIGDSASLHAGNIMIVENKILSAAWGVDLQMSSVNKLTGGSSFTFGNVTILDNEINAMADGIHIYLYDIGGSIQGDSTVTVGRFLIEGNDVRSDNYGVNLQMNWIGALMMDSSTMRFLGIDILDNTLVGRDGVHIGDLSQIGYDLYNSSRVEFGGLNVSANLISSINNGIYVAGTYQWGYMMRVRSTASIGDIIISYNEIDSQGNGVYFSDWYEIGINMEGNSSFIMGQISFNDNDIISNGDAIFTGNFFNLGFNLKDDSKASFGSISYRGNVIDTNSTGLFIIGVSYYGSYLYENSRVYAGDLQIMDNIISSFNMGIHFVGYYLLAYYLYSNSIFVHGNISIKYNTLISEDNNGLYIGGLSLFGYYLHDNSTCTIGDIDISENNINSHLRSIYIDRIEFIGYMIQNWSQFRMGKISISNNVMDSDEIGIYLPWISLIGFSIFEKANAVIGAIEIVENEMITDGNGIMIDHIRSIGNLLYSDAWMKMDGITISDNIIFSNGTGLWLYQISDVGMSIRDRATVDIGDVEISRNEIQADMHGVYFAYYRLFGVMNLDNSIVNVGNFSVVGNNIEAGAQGIFIDNLEHMGAYNFDESEITIGYFQFSDNVITSDTGFGIHLGDLRYWGDSNGHASRTRILGIDISGNEITSFLSGIHVYQINNFGNSIQHDASLAIGPLTINDNDINCNDEGIMIIFTNLGSNSVDGSALGVGSIEISDNTIDADDGIVLAINVGAPGGNVKVNIGDITVANNLVWTTDRYSITLPLLVSLSNQVRLSMGRIHVAWNDIQGSGGAGISILQYITLFDTSSTDFDGITILANNIEECSTGLTLNGTKGVEAYANNFINNGNDTDIYDTTIKWISPEPMWYRHGMRNHSSYIGNYWDRYTGSDANDDGIGDTPYNTGDGMDTHPLISEVENHLPPWNDVTPPEVFITSPANGTAFNVSSVQMSWVGADDLLGIDYYEIKLDNGPWVNVDMDVSYRFEDLSEGEHVLIVRAVDMAGNMDTDEIIVVVDLTDPTLTITSPEHEGYINNTDLMIEWEGMDAVSGIDHYMVKLDNGSWFDVAKLTGYLYVNITEGEHYVEVTAHDGAGNTHLARSDFWVDLTEPSLSILYPTEGLYVSSNSMKAEWSAFDTISGIIENRVKLDNGSWISIGVSNDYLFQNLTNGNHTLWIKVQDRAGNWKMESLEFKIGDDQPIITILSPQEGSFVASSNVEVKWSALGTTYAPMMFQARLDSGSWENLSIVYSRTFIDLPDGLHTVEVKLTDMGGNVATSMVSFIVDTNAPMIVNISHKGENAPPGDPIVIYFSERMDGTGFSLELNGDDVTGVLGEDGTFLTLEIEMETGTDYALDIQGQDLAGNQIVERRSFTTADKGTITGKLIDMDGDPIANAKIVLDTGEETYSDQNGDFQIEAPPGTRTVTIYDRDGNKLTEFEVEVEAGKEVTPTQDLTVNRHKDDEGSLLWLWILLAAIIVIVILGAVIFFIARKPGEEEEEEEDEDEDEDYDDEEYDDMEFGDDWDEE